MKKKVAKKNINFRISEEFEHFLEGMWRTNAFRKIGINSKTDLFRYAVINSIGKIHGIKILKEFGNIDEINNYLNPKPDTRLKELKEKINKSFGEQ